jgi:MFS family permease
VSAPGLGSVRLYQGFQFCFGMLFWLPVFYEYQRRIGLGDPEIFSIQSLYYVAFCLLEIPTGLVADQLGYRRSMRAGALVLVLANLLPVLLPSYQGMLWHFMLVALARSFVSGASSAWLYGYLHQQGNANEYKDAEGRARAYSLLGKVVGFAGVGAMMEWHLGLPYWLTVASALASLGFAMALPDVRPEAPGDPAEAGARARVGRSLAMVRGSPALMLIMLQGVAIFVLARICQVNLFQPILASKAATGR